MLFWCTTSFSSHYSYLWLAHSLQHFSFILAHRLTVLYTLKLSFFFLPCLMRCYLYAPRLHLSTYNYLRLSHTLQHLNFFLTHRLTLSYSLTLILQPTFRFKKASSLACITRHTSPLALTSLFNCINLPSLLNPLLHPPASCHTYKSSSHYAVSHTDFIFTLALTHHLSSKPFPLPSSFLAIHKSSSHCATPFAFHNGCTTSVAPLATISLFML